MEPDYGCASSDIESFLPLNQVLHDQLHDVVEILHTLFPNKVAEFITSHHHHEVEELLQDNRMSAAFDSMDSQAPLEREWSFDSTPRVSAEHNPPPNVDVHCGTLCQEDNSTLNAPGSSGALSTGEDWNRFLSVVKHRSDLRADRRIQFSSGMSENRSNQVVQPAAVAHHHNRSTDWL